MRDDNIEIDSIINNLDNVKYLKLSKHLQSHFRDWKNKRAYKNKEWANAKLQYEGKYDAETKAGFKPNRSKYFHQITTAKCDQYVSRFVDLVLPNGDKNFYLYSTPKPNLPKKLLTEIMENLNAQALESQTQVTEEDRENVILKVSNYRAKKMENVIYDQLLESGYMFIIQNVVRSATIYGTGVCLGPYNIKKKINYYDEDEFGNWSVKTEEQDFPRYEYVKVWDFFPDMDAHTKDKMIGAFINHTMTRSDLRKLADRGDFISENIDAYIECNEGGNYQSEPYELDTYEGGEVGVMSTTKNGRYRVKEYWGTVPARYLKEVEGFEDEKGDIEVCVWMIDDLIIKCIKNPFDSGVRPYNFYNYRDMDGELFGQGLPKLIEMDQRGINAISRALHDNAAYNAIPITEVNTSRLAPGENARDLYPGRILLTEGVDAEAGYPVLRTLQTTSIIPDLLRMFEEYSKRIDVITNLSQIMAGDLQGQSTIGRTSSGISALMGAASIVLRNDAKNFDLFNSGLLTPLIEWNIMFNKDNSIKGDFAVYPRVSSALVNKEIMSQNLSILMSSLTPQEMEYINPEGVLNARLSALNLDPDLIKFSEKEVAQNREQAQQQQAQQEQMAQQQMALAEQDTQSDINLKNAKAEAEMAKVQLSNDKNDIDRLKAVNQVDKDRTQLEIADAELKNKIMNEEDNFTQNSLNQLSQRINSQNPNLNP